MSALAKYTPIRTLAPVSGRDLYGDADVSLPAGAKGAVIEVWDNGAAYDVEFLLNLEAPIPACVVLTLPSGQISPQ